MSYKTITLNNERQHNGKYFSGGGGSKKCYNDRNLYTPNCNKVVIEKSKRQQVK